MHRRRATATAIGRRGGRTLHRNGWTIVKLATLHRTVKPELLTQPNALLTAEAAELGSADTTPDNLYMIGTFALEPDESLVLEFSPPDTRYWNITLESIWHECLEPPHRHSSVTNKGIRPDADGIARITVGGKDFGHAHWLDTGGRPAAMTSATTTPGATAWHGCARAWSPRPGSTTSASRSPFWISSVTSRLQIVKWRRENPDIAAQPVTRPIFIVGQPRTGTTILFELLAQDPALRPPLTRKVDNPFPLPRPETYDTDPRIAETQASIEMSEQIVPGLLAFHPMGALVGQECVRITAGQFCSVIFSVQYRLPSYYRWLLYEADHHPAYRYHRMFLQHLQSGVAGQWLLKSPAHLWQLDALVAEYPHALIVQTHRDPLNVISSISALTHHLRHLASDESSITESASSAGPRGGSGWFDAWQQADGDGAERLVQLARDVLPLDGARAGPAPALSRSRSAGEPPRSAGASDRDRSAHHLAGEDDVRRALGGCVLAVVMCAADDDLDVVDRGARAIWQPEVQPAELHVEFQDDHRPGEPGASEIQIH